ncbi:hypothetical protein [Tenacibaculum sp. 190524A05c]|uniref:Uncharacterized protein n=1 Tax=Tenacibaculum platacis TaxID=3137852 RepID=A0ABP1EJR1_9FLAO
MKTLTQLKAYEIPRKMLHYINGSDGFNTCEIGCISGCDYGNPGQSVKEFLECADICVDLCAPSILGN